MRLTLFKDKYCLCCLSSVETMTAHSTPFMHGAGTIPVGSGMGLRIDKYRYAPLLWRGPYAMLCGEAAALPLRSGEDSSSRSTLPLTGLVAAVVAEGE